jgi:hypothetical protein
VLRQVHTTSRDIGDEEQLQNDLKNGDGARDGNEEILIVLEDVERTGNHAKDIVDEQAKGRDSQEDVVEVALLLASEL